MGLSNWTKNTVGIVNYTKATDESLNTDVYSVCAYNTYAVTQAI